MAGERVLTIVRGVALKVSFHGGRAYLEAFHEGELCYSEPVAVLEKVARAGEEWRLCDICGVDDSCIGGLCSVCDILQHVLDHPDNIGELRQLLEARRKTNPVTVPSHWMAL